MPSPSFYQPVDPFNPDYMTTLASIFGKDNTPVKVQPIVLGPTTIALPMGTLLKLVSGLWVIVAATSDVVTSAEICVLLTDIDINTGNTNTSGAFSGSFLMSRLSAAVGVDFTNATLQAALRRLQIYLEPSVKQVADITTW